MLSQTGPMWRRNQVIPVISRLTKNAASYLHNENSYALYDMSPCPAKQDVNKHIQIRLLQI